MESKNNLTNITDNKVNNIKIVYTVEEIQIMLGIGKNQAYDLVKSGVFPVRKIGSKYLIPKAGFNNWLNCGNTFNDIA